MKAKNAHFFIGYGLPGSGKTTLLKGLKKEKHGCRYVDVDDLTRIARRSGKALEEYLKEAITCYQSNVSVIVDGLFTTNNDLIKLINLIVTQNSSYKENLSFTIYYWNEDRESCVWNDEYRRDENSLNSIRSLPYEIPDVKTILEKTGYKVKLIKQNVKRKEKYVHDANNLGFILSGKYLTSDSWCVGGTYCDCWGGSYAATASNPSDFSELDKFLEEKIPSLTFLQYKKIWRECVETDDYYESDYYGGGVTYMYYKCDMEKLYEILEKL